MYHFRTKRNKKKRWLYSSPVAALLIMAIVFLGNATWNGYQTYKNARVEEAQAADKLSELRDREAQLNERIDRLNTRRGLEEELRKRFNAVKEGEQIAVIVDEQAKSATQSSEADPASLWDVVKNWFGGE